MSKKRFKIQAFIPSLLLFLTIYTPLKAAEDDFQKFDETAYFNDDDYNIYDENFSNYILRTNHTSAQEIIDFITGPDINIQGLLEKNLYKYTNPANIRPLLDLPAYQSTYPFGIPCGISAGVTPFYTQTREQYLTAHSPYLCSYLSFSEFDSIEQMLTSLDLDLDSFDLPEILALFNTIKLEERRVGGIFNVGKTQGCCSLGLEFPFYYIERNMFLNKHEQDAIAKNPFFAELSGGCAPSSTVEDFIKQHIVGDLLGFGDMRFSAFWRRESNNAYLSGGFELTLPSAAIVMDHMIAHHRKRSPMQPVVDILSVVNPEDTTDNPSFQDDMTDLAVGALDRLLRTCADTKLGNETVTFAPRADLFHPMAHGISLAHMARFTCFMPYNTIRFFRECKTTDTFARNWSDATQANTNLQFLTTRLINLIYPQMQETKVDARFSFEYSLAMQFCLRKAMAEFGYDVWLMSQEHLCFACLPQNDTPLDLHGAESPAAMQQKIFARIMWEHEGKCGRLWHFGLVGDWTATSYGIGHDWSLGFTANVLW